MKKIAIVALFVLTLTFLVSCNAPQANAPTDANEVAHQDFNFAPYGVDERFIGFWQVVPSAQAKANVMSVRPVNVVEYVAETEPMEEPATEPMVEYIVETEPVEELVEAEPVEEWITEPMETEAWYEEEPAERPVASAPGGVAEEVAMPKEAYFLFLADGGRYTYSTAGYGYEKDLGTWYTSSDQILIMDGCVYKYNFIDQNTVTISYVEYHRSGNIEVVKTLQRTNVHPAELPIW